MGRKITDKRLKHPCVFVVCENGQLTEVLQINRIEL